MLTILDPNDPCDNQLIIYYQHFGYLIKSTKMGLLKEGQKSCRAKWYVGTCKMGISQWGSLSGDLNSGNI